MLSAEDYFNAEYRIEAAQLQHVDGLIADVWPLFVDCQTNNGWPYEIRSGSTLEVKHRSSSTNSMIVFIIGQLLGRLAGSTLLPFVPRPFAHQQTARWPSMRDKLRPVFQAGLKLLIKSASKKRPFFQSGSFGDDDPFTYGWVMELIADAQNDAGTKHLARRLAELGKRLAPRARERINAAFSGDSDAILHLPLALLGAHRERVGSPATTQFRDR